MKLKIFVLLLLFPVLINAQPVNPSAPPEYYPSKAVLIEWDFYNETWQLYSELIQEIKTEAEVILVVNNQAEENTFINYLNDADISLDNISFVHIPSGRMWIRDHGPLAIQTDNGVAYIDFEDFANSGASGALPTNLANVWGLDSYNLTHIILDGGNFMVDSHGNMFATDRLYSNNPDYSIDYINNLLEEYMGIQNIYTFSQMGSSDVWGHIDMQMKLLDDTTVVISSIQNGWPNHQVLEDNYDDFSQLTSPYGTPYRIRRLPKAENWKSYTNALFLNNKVIIPIYDHPNDDIAIGIYEELLPNHQIVGINANSIVGWDGVIHCITMQLFDDEQVTAIKNLSVEETIFEIFPNPTSNEVNIITDKNDFHVSIINLNGQIVFSEQNIDRINVSSFAKGIYFVRIKTDDGIDSFKLVVE
jgi:agmatine deiminase